MLVIYSNSEVDPDNFFDSGDHQCPTYATFNSWSGANE